MKVYPRLIAYTPNEDNFIVQEDVSIADLTNRVRQYYGLSIEEVYEDFVFAEIGPPIKVKLIQKITEELEVEPSFRDWPPKS